LEKQGLIRFCYSGIEDCLDLYILHILVKGCFTDYRNRSFFISVKQIFYFKLYYKPVPDLL
jgi:hypothetical protein